MNCANHADASAVAYCRTCGKPLCGNCTRPVRGVIYCEECLGARMEAGAAAPGTGTGAAGFVAGAPAATYAAAGRMVPPAPTSGPNPTVAGILGAIPLGIGAVYNGQYGKGLAHLAVFTFLVYGASHTSSWGCVAFSLAIAFFWFYQIFDAVRTAKAMQAGAPGPDPFGFAEMATGGAKIDSSKIPMGAIVLILIGLLFLLNTMGLTEYGLDRFWPIILIVLGGWLFARNWGLWGTACSGCQCARCRTRRLMGPSLLLTVGVLFLLDHSLHGPRFGQTWPVILLVIGLIKLLQGSASIEGHTGAMGGRGQIPPVSPPLAPDARSGEPLTSASVPPVVPPGGEVNRG